MENLKKYGEMLSKLNNDIFNDIKDKTDDELAIIEKEAKASSLTNSTWWEYKISKTVYEHVIYEKRLRQKNLVFKRIEVIKKNKQILALL